VAEERPLGQPGPFGDLRDGRVLEPALAVQRKGRLGEPSARIWFPSSHAPILGDDSG